jgi:hypothetical protein
MKKVLIVGSLVFSSLVFADWRVSKDTDLMTDKTILRASIEAETGESLTIMQRDDKSIWAFFKLANANTFSVDERLLLRVDKNEPTEYNRDFQDLTIELGKPMYNWEWNPNLIAFRIGGGTKDGDCNVTLKQLHNGKKLVIRHRPNKSTFRDVVFSATNGKVALQEVLDVDCISKIIE